MEIRIRILFLSDFSKKCYLFSIPETTPENVHILIVIWSLENRKILNYIISGGGDVAFIKHTTVMENTDGKRKEWWARNQLTTDYELLCRDGTRAPARNYESCYLGRVPANAIVTRKDISDDKIKAFINLFKYAQQFYGQKVPDEFSFSMYHSHTPFADLIFQDATQQLLELPEDKRDYTKYLDSEFLKAYTVVSCESHAISISKFALGISKILMVVMSIHVVFIS